MRIVSPDVAVFTALINPVTSETLIMLPVTSSAGQWLLLVGLNGCRGKGSSLPVNESERFDDEINDEKIMTAEQCVINCVKVASVKSELNEKIIIRLLNLETSSKYTAKQTALMMSHVIEGLELVVNNFPNKSSLIEFVKRQLTSISPKTRKTAKIFLEKYH